MKDLQLLLQKPLVDSFLQSGPRPLSAYSFVSIFAWCDFFDFEIKTIHGCLCIFARQPKASFLYLPPLGKHFDQATLQAAFKYMAGDKAATSINRIENIPENILSAFKDIEYNQYLKPSEYVYQKQDLIELTGNAYKSQRHDCNHFVNNHVHSLEPYTEADFNACLDLYDRWAQGRAQTNSDCIYRTMLEENRLVHARCLKFIHELGLVARVLKVDGNLAGYTFGFALDQNTFCVYAEITELKLTGAAAFLFKIFCSDDELKQYSRINTMDDFAMPMVAAAKKAYHPAEMIPSYTVSLKS